MRKVVVIGSYNVGLTVMGKEIPRPGQTVLGHGFDVGPGGKGSNQAIAARRLGAEVAFVARVGKDSFGAEALSLFRREGLSRKHVTVDPAHATGAGIIFLDEKGRNAIGVAPGANYALSQKDVAAAAHLFVPGGILLMQLECPLPVLFRAAQRAKRAGMIVILNPAPACPLSAQFLRLCDFLTPNETEAGELSGVAVRDLVGAEKAGRRLLGRGAGSVIVTLGGGGSLLVEPGRTVHTPAYKVRAVDTTGAGDAFNGAFACGLARGWPVTVSVDFASKAGAFCVTKLGVIAGLPTLAELDRKKWIRSSGGTMEDI